MTLTILQMAGAQASSEGSGDWLITVSTLLQHGHRSNLTLYGAGMVFLLFFYTAVQFNSEERPRISSATAAFIPASAPASRRSFTSTICSTAITVVGQLSGNHLPHPEILFSQAGVPFYLGGTSY